MPDGVGGLLGSAPRLPPSNVEAEQALLGAILANNNAYARVADFLLPEHFADTINGRIYEAACKRIDGGQIADAVTLKREFENAGILDEVGGTVYLTQLLTAMVGIINAGDYARAVYDTWQRRQLIDFAEDVSIQAWAPGAESKATEDIIDEAESRLMKIGASTSVINSGSPLEKSVSAAIREGEAVRDGKKASALSCGYPSIDEKILGLRPGNLIILAGRPGMGKTTVANSIALNVALGRSHQPSGEIVEDPTSARLVLSFCFEATKEDFGASCTSALASVEIKQLLNGTYDNKTAERIVLAERRVRDAPLISYHMKMSLRQIARTAKSVSRKFKMPLGLIIVDYLQLMPDHRGMDKRLSVGTNTNGLKALAMELGVPIILGSQLSRGVEARPDKQPTMSDLRETGEIEDSADVIMLLYRKAYYFAQTRPPYDNTLSASTNALALSAWQADLDLIKYNLDVLIPKVRRGEAPTIANPNFNGAFSRIEEPRR